MSRTQLVLFLGLGLLLAACGGPEPLDVEQHQRAIDVPGLPGLPGLPPALFVT